MKSTLIPAALLLILANAARADFNPVALTAGSYTKDMVVEHNAPATPSGASTTASMDAGTGNTGYSWYEQGYNTGAPGTGLPTAGSTFASATFPTHHYTMPPELCRQQRRPHRFEPQRNSHADRPSGFRRLVIPDLRR